MKYKPVKEIANDFEISLKSVYNYISKFTRIQRKKQGRTTVIHFEDFERAFNGEFKDGSKNSN